MNSQVAGGIVGFPGNNVVEIEILLETTSPLVVSIQRLSKTAILRCHARDPADPSEHKR